MNFRSATDGAMARSPPSCRFDTEFGITAISDSAIASQSSQSHFPAMKEHHHVQERY
jgi:hypothetical protein